MDESLASCLNAANSRTGLPVRGPTGNLTLESQQVAGLVSFDKKSVTGAVRRSA
jgi:hypothetical protein